MNAIIVSALWGVVMMFTGLAAKAKMSTRIMAVLGLVVLLAANLLDMGGIHIQVNVHNMLYFDTFGLLFNCIAFVATLLLVLLSADEIEQTGSYTGEYYALIFFVLCGVSIASTFNSLLMLFLGIEIISIPLYILTGSNKRNLKSNEASLKYFLMGAFSTGLMLLGIAFLYGANPAGSFFIDDLSLGKAPVSPLYISGLLFLLIAMAFKASAAPFHFWTPDVYDGAPTVFTSFMATVVKAAVFIAFFRLFHDSFGNITADWQIFIAILTAATLFIGNITAVFQQSVKRMLAYSSIAQAGFMLFAVLTLSNLAMEGIIFYVTAYSLATIGIFAILAKMKDSSFEGFNGLAARHPLLAAVNVIFLLSLAGIPLTAGFFAKYYMLASAIQSGKFLWLVIFAIFCAAVSVYYYFRLIIAMYFKEGTGEPGEVSPFFKTILVVVAAAVILLGIFPQLLLDRLYNVYI